MARAYLNINKEIYDALVSAQDSTTVRLVKVRIIGEEMRLDGVIDSEGAVESDFETLLPSKLGEKEACIALFRLSFSKSTSGNWILVAWVPDGCKVRDKMLYSSSREDLKKTLGQGYFKAEYAANVKEDLTWAQLQAHLTTEDKALYSETEKLLQGEKALAQQETHASKSIAMGVLPLAVPPETKDAISEFTRGDSNFLEVHVVSETIIVSKKSLVPVGEKLIGHVSSEEARFYIVSQTTSFGEQYIFFIYSCPESVPIKSKMMMASSKATVIGTLKEAGVNINKTIEVRGVDEIDDLVSAELNPTTTQAGSINVDLAHAKPLRPGRPVSKPKIAKFEADEDF